MNFRTEDDVVHRKYFRLIKTLLSLIEFGIIEENKKFTLYQYIILYIKLYYTI